MQDNNFLYNVGDTYPREGYTATERRIDELSGSANKQHTPLIKARQNAAESVSEEVSEDAPEDAAEQTKSKSKRRGKRTD